MCTKVFRDLLIVGEQLDPPPPPWLLGIVRFGAHDYPPTTWMKKGEECG